MRRPWARYERTWWVLLAVAGLVVITDIVLLMVGNLSPWVPWLTIVAMVCVSFVSLGNVRLIRRQTREREQGDDT